MRKEHANIKAIETDTIAELLELNTVAETAKLLGCSQAGLQYQMTLRGLKSPHYRSPRHFDNLSQAKLKYYGYPGNLELLKILQKLGATLGHRPSKADLKATVGLPPYSVFESRFGGWNKALKAAGFELTTISNRAQKSQKPSRELKKNNKVTPLEKRIYKTMTPRLRYAILARDSFRCVYCGRNPKDDNIKLDIDHILPQSKGGLTTYENLVACCQECNQGKHNHYQLSPST